MKNDKINSPILTLILYVLIVLFSIILFLYYYAKFTNAFFSNLFYLFYFNIGLSFIIALMLKKPLKIVFFVFSFFQITLLVLYTVFFLWMNLMAGATH